MTDMETRILETIDRNGFYSTPAGFLDEPYSTEIHTALRSLKEARHISLEGMDGGHERWVRDDRTAA